MTSSSACLSVVAHKHGKFSILAKQTIIRNYLQQKQKHSSAIWPQTTCGKTTGPCKLPKLKAPPKYKDTMTSIREEEEEEQDEGE